MAQSQLSNMDDFFDLDLSLTMEDHHYNTTTITTKEAKPPSIEEARNQVFAMKTITDIGSSVCIVCLEGFNSSCTSGKQAPCGHVYHFDCIMQWLSLHDSCPLCRSKVSDHHRISL
ncbi:putative transcription factor C2H2 family [Helianthus annuus]|uniref:RING-type E3 ubiquitin transferase n=1 Tax=Helianthus annuus TaxID=4232 RepID=A0A9K3JCM9_HELAN|nr:putative transcription factor C2H2 family [Helianthus annuus]KAJ0941832.1 putative transcription factor C2H2 family [Helianthus annuus]